HPPLYSFPTRRSSDLDLAAHREESPAAHEVPVEVEGWLWAGAIAPGSKAPESSEVTDVDAGLDCFDFDEAAPRSAPIAAKKAIRSEEHTSELQSRGHL